MNGLLSSFGKYSGRKKFYIAEKIVLLLALVLKLPFLQLSFDNKLRKLMKE